MNELGFRIQGFLRSREEFQRSRILDATHRYSAKSAAKRRGDLPWLCCLRSFSTRV